MRRRSTREQVNRAYRQRCHQRCQDCQRLCPTDHVYGHVMDCCGLRVVHELRALRDGELDQVTITNPMRAGYMAGPTRTRPRSRLTARERYVAATNGLLTALTVFAVVIGAVS